MSLTEIQRTLSRMEQRISNLIRIGRVAEVQDSPPRVKVEYDKDAGGKPVLTAWLRYFEERQGFVQTWNPPKVGEQCTILSPSGVLRMGVVLLGLNTTNKPPISSDSSVHQIKFEDGSTFAFNRASSQWDISLGGGSASFNGVMFTFNADLFVNGDIIQVGDFDQEGNITTTGNIIGNMVSDSIGSMVAIRTTYNGHHHNARPEPPTILMN
jgi:phage baseplate assembly protein V